MSLDDGERLIWLNHPEKLLITALIYVAACLAQDVQR